MKQLLVETEKLSAEVLGLRGQNTRLQLQLEVGASTRRHPLPPRHPSHPPLPLLLRSSRRTTGTSSLSTGPTSSTLPRWDPTSPPRRFGVSPGGDTFGRNAQKGQTRRPAPHWGPIRHHGQALAHRGSWTRGSTPRCCGSCAPRREGQGGPAATCPPPDTKKATCPPCPVSSSAVSRGGVLGGGCCPMGVPGGGLGGRWSGMCWGGVSEHSLWSPVRAREWCWGGGHRAGPRAAPALYWTSPM